MCFKKNVVVEDGIKNINERERLRVEAAQKVKAEYEQQELTDVERLSQILLDVEAQWKRILETDVGFVDTETTDRFYAVVNFVEMPKEAMDIERRYDYEHRSPKVSDLYSSIGRRTEYVYRCVLCNSGGVRTMCHNPNCRNCSIATRGFER